MKNFKFLSLIVAIISVILLSSCNNKKTEPYWQSIGTLTTVNSASSFTLVDDNGVVINIKEVPFVLSTEYEGKRASITFVRTDEVIGENDKVINGRLMFMNFIEVGTPTSLSQFGSEAEIQKELGQQYITPKSAWFGGYYLNIAYRAGFSNLNEKRKVALAIDNDKSTSTEIVASLYYKADDAPKDYYFNNFAEGMIAFDMRGLGYDKTKVITVSISYIDAEMRGENVFVVKSDNSISKAPMTVSSQTISFAKE